MAYRVSGKGRNQRIQKLLFGCSLYRNSIMWYDVGPYVRPNQFNRALCLMSRLEQRGLTSHWLYDAARNIAQDLLGIGDKKKWDTKG
jgi:hypothetical protein